MVVFIVDFNVVALAPAGKVLLLLIGAVVGCVVVPGRKLVELFLVSRP